VLVSAVLAGLLIVRVHSSADAGMNSAHAEDIHKRPFRHRTSFLLNLKKRSRWTKMMAHSCRSILLSRAQKMKRGEFPSMCGDGLCHVWRRGTPPPHDSLGKVGIS
jgi:hypothetical protein